MTQLARSRVTRLLYALLAYTSLGIGLVAIVIPGLPTTEFILLAAWAATRSSPRLSAWLERHRLFGPILHNWRNGKVIQRRAKVSATVSMLLCAGLMLLVLEHHWPVFLAIGGMALGNLWIWSRPERAVSLSAPVPPSLTPAPPSSASID
ncbi:YbaN family protein [Pseudomonas sp.]|uniref:YbaN family protein n=1 Tax=Pseudomonas sp. TaxID=306 RepID=UPI0028AA9A45|nr:YbaN family protein [Pseudomonas sp.]